MADCCKDNSITVYRGFDTRFMGVDFLSIKFESQFDLNNYSAKFILGTHTQTWDTLVDGVIINLTKEETSQLPLGIVYGTLIVFDNEGKSKPFSTAIPFMCTEWVEGTHQKIDQFNMSVDAKFEGETVMTITIETAQVSEQMVDDKIAEHNESEVAHQDIRESISETRSELLEDIDELAGIVDTKQDKLIAGDGIDITDNVITNTRRSAEWGNIVGSIENQQDLQEQFDTKQDKLTSANAGDNITIEYKDGIVKINGKAGGGGFGELDGGSSTSVYIDPDQIIDAGNAFEP